MHWLSRAHLGLWSARGQSNSKITDCLGWTKATVGKWRQRFLEQRVPRLYDELRPGRRCTLADEQIASML